MKGPLVSIYERNWKTIAAVDIGYGVEICIRSDGSRPNHLVLSSKESFEEGVFLGIASQSGIRSLISDLEKLRKLVDGGANPYP